VDIDLDLADVAVRIDGDRAADVGLGPLDIGTRYVLAIVVVDHRMPPRVERRRAAAGGCGRRTGIVARLAANGNHRANTVS
jgi:hypothetical protein